MADEIVTLDPRDNPAKSVEGTATRAASLDGKRIGLLSNNKPNSEMLLRFVADLIGESYSIGEVVEANKGSHRIPAPQDMLDDLANRCDAVIVSTAE